MYSDQSLLEQAISIDNLRFAWNEVAENNGAGGVDNVSIKKWRRTWEDRIYKLNRSVHGNRYKPQPLRVLRGSLDECERWYTFPQESAGLDAMVILLSEVQSGKFVVGFLCNHMGMDAAGLRFFLRDVAGFLTGRAQDAPNRANPVIAWADLLAAEAPKRAETDIEDRTKTLLSDLQDTAAQNKHPCFQPSAIGGSTDGEDQVSQDFAVEERLDAGLVEALCYKALAQSADVPKLNYLTYDGNRWPVFGTKSHIFAPGGFYSASPVIGRDAELTVPEIAELQKVARDANRLPALLLMSRRFVLGTSSTQAFPLPHVIFNIRNQPTRDLADLKVRPATPSWCPYVCALNISAWQDKGNLTLSVTRGAATDPDMPSRFFARLKALLQ